MFPEESKQTLISSLDDLGNILNNGVRKKKFRTILKPFSDEEEQFPDTGKHTLDQRDTHSIDIVHKLVLPTKSIDQLPTLVNLEVVHALLPTTSVLGTYSISKELTRKVPVIQSKTKVLKQDSSDGNVQGYTSQFRKLIRSSGIYAISSLASPLVSLVLAPFLTRNLSVEDFGALAVINTAIALLAGLTQLGLASAFFRSYNYDYETQSDRIGVISTVVDLLLMISIPITITIMIMAPTIGTFLLKSPSFGNAIRAGALVVLLQNLTVPGFAWLRANNRAGLFTTLSIVNLFVNLSITVLLVGILHMGIVGSIIGTGSGYTAVILCTLPFLLIMAGLRLRIDIARGLLSFGLPNMTNFISIWVLQLSDRYLLSFLGSLAQTASYAVAYSLGGIMNVIVLSPFTLAWPTAMFTIAKQEDAPKKFQLVFRWYSIVLLFAAFALSVAGTIVLYIFFPPAYHSAAPIIPVIALSTMFYGVYNIFNTGISIKRKVWFAVVFTTISALINVGLNLILIPLFGAMGAAVSTLIAYAILALMAYIVNQRIYPIPFEIGTFIIELMIGVGFYIGSNFLAQGQGIFEASSIFFGSLCLYGGCLLLFGKSLTRSNKETYN